MYISIRSFSSLLITIFLTLNIVPVIAEEPARQPTPLIFNTYHRLLPLEGGSNFRDIGGYKTSDNKTVIRGQLFRSGSLSALTDKDILYLDQIGFRTVVDLRSSEEIELFPNQWVKSRSIDYLSSAHSHVDILPDTIKSMANVSMEDIFRESYKHLPVLLQPHFKIYFSQLLAGNTPIVVNCFAGQDRTGAATALLLSALGVPRDIIIEDYLLSTDYRDLSNEFGNVDLQKASETNSYAKLLLQQSGKGLAANPRPNVLKSAQGVPYIQYFFDQIEKDYGSVENYLNDVIGVTAMDISRLRSLYLR